MDARVILFPLARRRARARRHLRISRTHAGFTAYELLISLAIISIVTGFGAGLYPVILDQQLVTAVNGVMTDLYLARSEAIKRHHPVTLCKSADGASCTRSSRWENGWIIFVDTNGNRRVNADDVILRVQQGLSRGTTLGLRAAFGHNHDVTYYPSGFSEKNGTFTFCDARGAPKARAIILYYTGRPRVSRSSAQGKALQCDS